MKNVIFIATLCVLCSFSPKQKHKSKMRYFNADNIEISNSEFEKIRATNKFLDITGDSINHRILIKREHRGKLTNFNLFKEKFEKGIEQKLEKDKTIVIIFHPGKDKCNSIGNSDSYYIKSWFRQLEKRIYKIAKTKPFYICKNREGLKKYDNIIQWTNDPKQLIENTFFNYHYPGSSFVVISKNGEFICYFGEFPKEYVWNSVKILTKHSKTENK